MTAKEDAIRSRTGGESLVSISLRLGVHRNTIRNWTDPETYKRNLEQASRWQKENPEKDRITDEQRLRRNARVRNCYAKKEIGPRIAELGLKHGARAQAVISMTLRSCVLGHADRMPESFVPFITAATGMGREEFGAKFCGAGGFVYRVPMRLFDLTQAEHVLRVVHPTNLRIATAEEMDGEVCDPSIDILTLPLINTTDAINQAKALISRCLHRLDRGGYAGF